MRAVEVPPSFLAMPRWWHADDAERGWLDDLPRLVTGWRERWGLTVDGAPRHGSNALVVPVFRADDGSPAVLRLAPPHDDVAALLTALRVWAGHGAVGVLAADVPGRALLLERLDADRSLVTEPLDVALREVGRVARALAVPVPPEVAAAVPHTAQVVAERTAELRPTWRRLGAPFGEAVVARAEAAAAHLLAGERPRLAVNADLHFGQVLAAPDGVWRTIDPVLQVGDPERTAVEVLWHRVDELDDDEIPGRFDVLVAGAALDPTLALSWALWRTTDYCLWGLEHGLTLDPARCGRILAALSRRRAG